MWNNMKKPYSRVIENLLPEILRMDLIAFRDEGKLLTHNLDNVAIDFFTSDDHTRIEIIIKKEIKKEVTC